MFFEAGISEDLLIAGCLFLKRSETGQFRASQWLGSLRPNSPGHVVSGSSARDIGRPRPTAATRPPSFASGKRTLIAAFRKWQGYR